MTDMAKCTGETAEKKLCPLRDNCYRYTAESGEWQSWIETPLDEDGKCELLWDTEAQEDKDGD